MTPTSDKRNTTQPDLFAASAAAAPATVSLDRFVAETDLMPAITLDGVARNLFYAVFIEHPENEAVWAYLNSPGLLERIEQRACAAYSVEGSQFRRRCKGRDPRDYFASFVRHWLSADVKRHQPQWSGLVPDHFALGTPID